MNRCEVNIIILNLQMKNKLREVKWLYLCKMNNISELDVRKYGSNFKCKISWEREKNHTVIRTNINS